MLYDVWKIKDVILKLINVKNVCKKGNFENKFVCYININYVI